MGVTTGGTLVCKGVTGKGTAASLSGRVRGPDRSSRHASRAREVLSLASELTRLV